MVRVADPDAGAQGELITSGPFAVAKHPLYTSVGLLVLPAAGILLGTWLGVVIGVALYVGARLFAPAEEQELRRRFGTRWDAYLQRVMLPWLWARTSSRSGAAGGDLVGPVAAGVEDQVLVQLEPGAVVAVDARRGDVAVVAGRAPRRRAARGAPVGGEARQAGDERLRASRGVGVERRQVGEDLGVVGRVGVVVEAWCRRSRASARP